MSADGGEQSFEIGNGISGSLLFETAPDEQCPLKRSLMIDALLIETLGFNAILLISERALETVSDVKVGIFLAITMHSCVTHG